MAGQENSLEDAMATTALAKPSSSITTVAGKEELCGCSRKSRPLGFMAGWRGSSGFGWIPATHRWSLTEPAGMCVQQGLPPTIILSATHS